MSDGIENGQLIPSGSGSLLKTNSGLARRGLDELSRLASIKGRVLLVNDQGALVEVEQILAASGYEVRSTSRQQDAIALANSFAPHVAMLGITLPVELGRELFTVSPWTKLVLWGEVREQEDLEQRRDHYDFELLPAPFDSETLLSGMKTWMAEAWTQRGNPLHAKGQWLDALICHEKALAIDARCFNAWLNKALCLDELGRWPEAITCCDAAIEINGSDWTPWIAKGDLLDRAGRFEEAIACFDQALEISRDVVSGWMGRGHVLHHLGRYEEALRCHDKRLEVIARNTTFTAYGRAYAYSDAWNGKAATLYRMRRYDESIQCCDKAIQFDARCEVAWYNKGNNLRELKRFDEAVACYDKALEFFPEHAKSWNNKGICFRKLGRLEEALLCHEKALAFDAQEIKALYNEALVQEDLGRMQDAIGSYEKYLAVAPPGADVQVKHVRKRLQRMKERNRFGCGLESQHSAI